MPYLQCIFFSTLISIIYQLYNCRDEFERYDFLLIDKKIFYSGLSILITSLSKFTFGGFSRILIKENLGFAALGIFTLVWQFISLVSIYSQQIISVTRLKIAKIIQFSEFKEYKKISLLLLFASLAPAIGFIILTQLLLNINYFNYYYFMVEKLIPIIGVYMVVAALDSFIPLYYIPLKLETTALKVYITLSLSCIILLATKILPDNLYSYMLAITATHFIAILIIALEVLKKVKISRINHKKINGRS